MLLVEPQRLFADRLARVLAPVFDVIPAGERAVDVAHDVALIDADAASPVCVDDIVRRNDGRTPVCLLSLNARPQAHGHGARAHVLSKALGEHELLAVVKRIAHGLGSALRIAGPLPQLPDVRFSSTYGFARRECGGDWYDVFETHGRIAFAIGDVAGHGEEASRSMNLVRHAMVRLALENTDPADILSAANKLIISTDGLYATALCGYIDPASRAIAYATAGHPPPVLAQPVSQPAFLETGGIMLGAFAGATYHTITVQAAHDALLVLYTDGVTERDGDLIDGERRLLAAVRQAAVQGALDAASAIQQAMFVEKAPVDDVAILAVTFGPRAY